MLQLFASLSVLMVLMGGCAWSFVMTALPPAEVHKVLTFYFRGKLDGTKQSTVIIGFFT